MLRIVGDGHQDLVNNLAFYEVIKSENSIKNNNLRSNMLQTIIIQNLMVDNILWPVVIFKGL